VPYYKDIFIDEEDSVALSEKLKVKSEKFSIAKISIAVVLLRHISNFTDFDTLERDPRVNLFYTNNVQDLQRADIIILPGTKSTLDDLLELRRNGCAQAILRAHRDGKTVVGICGGYQMMGLSVDDPDGIEGPVASLPGLGLLPIRTVITPEKTTRQATFQFDGHECHGYEIHQGISVEAHADVVAHASQRGSSNDVVAHTSQCGSTDDIVAHASQRGNTDQPVTLGSVTYYDHCIGTYIHGFLDNPPVIEHLLKGHSAAPAQSLADFKEEQYDKLAAHVRQYVDVDRIYQILGSDKS
jgi:adenosylcobyric acid synthase